MEHRRLFILPNHVNSVPEARERAEAELASLNLNLSPRRAGAMSLALTEAFSNILRHAVPPEVDSVDMTLTFDGETICVSFEYPGIPFDPSTIPNPDFTGESDGGFGYFIIEQLTDNVAYAFGENGRHRVDLRWVYPEQAPLEI